jgi:putative DNA primase/helicase
MDVRARCVDRLGWHGGVYVMPGEIVGHNGETVVFQNPQGIEPAFSLSGTVEQWRNNIGNLARGNSRVIFSICTAFAGTLLNPAGEDSGGFHFRGPSSIGKSTAQKIGASLWGAPEHYCHGWHTTTNGLEGLANLHNDNVLFLDELSQVDPREAGAAAYLLANGKGKVRANRTGAARQSASWRLLFLSSGEESLSGLMNRAGEKATAGQEIRLAEIAADAGAGLGAFEELHECANGPELVLALKDAASRYHGAVGREWLRLLVRDRCNLGAVLADGIREFVAEFAPNGCSGQVVRVARRFGLVAVAGEIATLYGLTGWDRGESIHAVGKCFASWLDGFGGTGSREERTLLAQVRGFLEKNGASRFQDVSSDDEHIINRAGFFRLDSEKRREYLVFPECFRHDLCAGVDRRYASRILHKYGWLLPGSSDRAAQKVRLPGMGPTWVYVFSGGMWEEDEA